MENKPKYPRLVKKSWGYEIIFAETPEYRGKILHIDKGKSFHLQKHEKKNESMYVLKGKGYIIRKSSIGYTFDEINPGESYTIPASTIHKIWAYPDRELELIEVSNGISDEDVEHLERSSP